MGYIRKHKEDIRSGVELTLIMGAILGLAPAMILISAMGY
jgi:hypothetical protein